MQNLEIKAYCPNIQSAQNAAKAIGASKKWVRWQKDTYFAVSGGRLKLRETKDDCAELIAYQRPRKSDAKISDYAIYKIDNPNQFKQVLEKVLPAKLVVEKKRELYLWHNVRIHLDEVKGLGFFIEFEAVLDSTDDLHTSQERLDFLSLKFGIRKKDLVSKGYFELLESQQHNA